jgi:cytochrome c
MPTRFTRLLFATLTLGLAASLMPAPAALAQDTDLPPLESGASVRQYQLDRSIAQLRELIPGQTPNRAWIAPVIDFTDTTVTGPRAFGEITENFLITVTGWIRIEGGGEYGFRLWSDDGSRMSLEGTRFLDNDGLHGAQAVDGSRDLSPGYHPFAIEMFEASGDAMLRLEWRPPGATEWATVPEDVLFCRRGEVRVTSPGPKKVMLPLMRGRPGDGRPLDAVHPSFDLVDLRPEDFRPRVGGIDWLPDGRMLVCTWDDIGAVYLLDGTDGSGPEDVTVTRIAAGLAEPLGLCVVGDRIFVLQKQELTELIDHDGDDIIDEYRAACSGWDVTANFHEFAFGLVERDGYLYATLAIAIDPGGRSTQPQVPDRGSVIRMDPEAGTYEIVARGLRTPNGIGFGAGGDIYITDNQGDWLPVSKVLPLIEGAFYGSQAVGGAADADLEVTPPVVWLPQNEIGNSPGEVAALEHGPFRGQQVHAEVTHGGLKRVFVEEIDGVKQGAVFRFTQGLEAGSNRVRLGPPSAASAPGTPRSLYVGGIGSTGNWGQAGKLWYGLQRLDWNGRATFEMFRVRARTNGFLLDFTRSVDTATGNAPRAYSVTRYRYEPTAAYGGPKIDEEIVRVRSVSMDGTRRRVFLELDEADMLPGFVYHVQLMGPWRDVEGRRPWTTEAWYTMNRVPQELRETPAPVDGIARANTLSAEERAAGFRLLFDGSSTDGWMAYGGGDVPAGWQIVDGALTRVGDGAGDIVTTETFANFELKLEWAVAPGGNSGIFWRVADGRPAVWSTGPEMQILDNERHADGQSPLTSAGSCYALLAPDYDATFPPGYFNEARIVADGPNVEYWLNGELQCRFDLESDLWRELVANSKFAGMPDFGRIAEGRIALQDHGDEVSFRSIRIRTW